MKIVEKWIPFEKKEKAFAMTRFISNQAGPKVLITTGIHGAEYTPIETGKQLAAFLKKINIYGEITILHLLNSCAFYDRIPRLYPEDNKNLNRQFPGDPNGSMSERFIHHLVENYIKKNDFYFDLHAGDLLEDLTPLVFYPHFPEIEVSRKSKALAKVSGFPYMVPSKSTVGSLYGGIQSDTVSLLTECGKKGRVDLNDVKYYLNLLLHLLQKVGSIDHNVALKPVGSTIETSPVTELYADFEGMWYPKYKANDIVLEDGFIGHIEDIFGQVLQKVYAQKPGLRVMYVEESLGIRKGDFLIALADTH